jgi:hypothetical protein
MSLEIGLERLLELEYAHRRVNMSTREKMARILTVPFFIAGVCWFWIRRAFVKGMEWEANEFPHLKDNQ